MILLLLTIHLVNSIITPDACIQASGGWLDAFLSGMGGVINGIFSSSNTDYTNRTNARLVKETNEANARINRENNEFNRSLAVQMFNMENAYNDPKEQMKRLKAAGVNPYVAAGSVGSVEGRADTIPAQNPIPMQAPQYQPVNTNAFTQGFHDVASAFASLAQGEKTREDAETVRKTRAALLKDLENSAELKGYQARNELWQNCMNQLYGEKRLQKLNRNLDADWAKLQQDMTESDARTVYQQIQADIAEIDRQTKDAQLKAMLPWMSKIARQEYENKVKEGREIDSRTSANIASAHASFASAQQAKAAAEQMRQLTPYLVRGAILDNKAKGRQIYSNDLQNGRQILENYEKIKTLSHSISQKMLQTSAQRIALDYALEQLKQAKVNSNWQEAEKAAAIIHSILSSVTGSASTMVPMLTP